MSIADIISRKKAELFVARDMDKLTLQKAALEKQRKQVEAENLERAKFLRAQNDVREEQRKLKLAKNATKAGRRDAVKNLFNNLGTAAKRIQNSGQGVGQGLKKIQTGVNNFGNGPTKSPFSPSGKGPFNK